MPMPPSLAPYETSLQHVLAELERIDLLIRVQVWRARQLHQSDQEFQGLYISEQEVDDLLAEPAGMPRWAVAARQGAADVPEALDGLAQVLAARKAASEERGVVLRLAELARRFGLSAQELDVLLIALAPEVDLRYERLFAYLQDDVTKRRPSVDLALNLLCPDLEAKLAARACFGDGAPLVRHRLIRLFEDPSRPQPPLLARYLKVEERVAAWLLGADDLDARLAPYARRVEPAARLEDLVLPEEWKRRVQALAEAGADGAVLYLQGPYGVGKETLAEALCAERGVSLLVVELDRLLAAHSAHAGDDETFETVLDLAAREAVLQRAALYWQGFDALLEDDRRARRARFLARLDDGAAGEHRRLAFLAGQTDWEPADALHEAGFVRVPVPLPGAAERAEMWARALAGSDLDPEVDAAALANKFRFTGGQIRDARRSRDPGRPGRRGAGSPSTTSTPPAGCSPTRGSPRSPRRSPRTTAGTTSSCRATARSSSARSATPCATAPASTRSGASAASSRWARG
jgi:hypothetical protein